MDTNGDKPVKQSATVTCLQTNSTNPDFIMLVAMLDAYLHTTDGEDFSHFAKFNRLDTIKYVIVAYKNDIPVGCGAIKEFSNDTMELKRMFVNPEYRGQGIAIEIVHALENWSRELNYKKCILETGVKQVAAVSLYTKLNYQRIPNYGQYANDNRSVCFIKSL